MLENENRLLARFADDIGELFSLRERLPGSHWLGGLVSYSFFFLRGRRPGAIGSLTRAAPVLSNL